MCLCVFLLFFPPPHRTNERRQAAGIGGREVGVIAFSLSKGGRGGGGGD